jgi:hypothetical protein
MKGAKSMVERAPKRNRQKIAEFCNAIEALRKQTDG